MQALRTIAPLAALGLPGAPGHAQAPDLVDRDDNGTIQRSDFRAL